MTRPASKSTLQMDASIKLAERIFAEGAAKESKNNSERVLQAVLDGAVINIKEHFKLEGSNRVTSWEFEVKDVVHTIELTHNTVWGKRKIKLNGSYSCVLL